MDNAIIRAFKEQEFDSGMALVQQVPDLANYQSALADDMVSALADDMISALADDMVSALADDMVRLW
jgi:hypothetical protein